MDTDKPKPSLWEWVKAISTVALVGVACIKIFQTPVVLTVDFPTLLSLLLALFSVALAALFYFKATETSNTFYDNTYKFTRDIAQLLAKMESGFGERLRHLDEGYSSMRTYLQSAPIKPNEEVEKTQKKLESEQQEVQKVSEERDAIIKTLVERSQLEQEEKEAVLAQLKSKEEELTKVQDDVAKLNRHLLMERLKRRRERTARLDSGMARFTKSHVVEKIGIDKIREAPGSVIRRAFTRVVEDMPRGYIEDLERHGLFDNGLTPAGITFLKNVAAQDEA